MVIDGMDAPTASGESFTVNTDPIRINEDSVVIAADIMATNGVIHVIDNIIASQAVSQTIADLAVADDNLSTLVAALTAADLVGAISADGPITCLGKIMLNNDTVLRRCPCPPPTNDAFAALPEGTVDSLLLPENVETLKDILLTHCISGNILSSMVTSGPITTLSGNTIEAVVNDDGTITFDGSTVITADVVASNGIAHVIDKVIVPTSDEAAATTVAPTTAAPTTEAAKDDTHDDGDDIDHSMDE
ncbi:fasciclin domain-containing protein [Skeletonema marinoi]|uniref:Fasciclin domain-containing protein n=1 Tax=Skeletonema marinoi TaxID=267567 RepID=A0AAD9DFK5_9STRA|nr:fasciclin domain-containing protein [Skeletonema marinoi]